MGIDFSILSDKLCVEVENYLVKYCSDSLQRLFVKCGQPKTLFKNLQKPFKNVIALSIIVPTFQTKADIQFLNECTLPNLQHIYFYDLGNGCQESETIHYKSIEYFDYKCMGRIQKFPFSFGNLRHFTIVGHVELNDAFCECIRNIEHLETLKISNYDMRTGTCSPDSFRKIFELQNIVSNVVKMHIQFHENITPELVHRFLKQSRKLRKLSFHVKIPENYFEISFANLTQTLPPNLNDEWKCSTVEPYENPLLYTGALYKCFVVERVVP